MIDIALTEEELERITGGLTQPRRQLEILHERGFARARLERGKLILERAHYEAVCRGEFAAGQEKGDTPRPQLRAIKKAA